MQFRLVIAVLTLVSCNALTRRSDEKDHSLDSLNAVADRNALLEAEAEERSFLTAALAAQEAELVKLQEVAEQGLASPNASSKNVPASNATAHEHHKSPLAGLKLNLNPKSTADLIPALAMLKGMYEDGKERIGKLNAREKMLKDKFAEKETTHQARIVKIEADKKSGRLNDEFYTNETRDETRMWKYWEGCRTRQHKQFHTSLKIQHATMTKVKTMIDMYEKTISGKADQNVIKKELTQASGGGMPEIVFIQTAWRETALYCHDALTELRDARKELLRAHDGDGTFA